ncbi:MAG: S9 family peptidase [Bdellovibrionales bacterium]|nr:S9 family peptidase [Bdellovibrionales bacterium]
MRLLCFLVLLVGCSSMPSNKGTQLTFDQFNQITSAASYLPLNDRKRVLLLTRFPEDEYRKLYSFDIETGKRELVYDAGQSIGWLDSDEPNNIIYLGIDNKGDEQYQIYELDLKTKTTQKIIGHKDRKASLISTDASGNQLLIRSNHLDRAEYRPFIYNRRTKKLSKPLTKKGFGIGWAKMDWQKQRLVITKSRNNATSDLYEVNLKTREPKLLHATLGTSYSPSYFKGDRLYLNTSHGKDRVGCAYIEMNNPKKINWVRYDNNKDLYCFYDKTNGFSGIWSSGMGRSTTQVFEGHFGKEQSLTKNPETELVKRVKKVPGKVSSYIVERFPLGKPPELFFVSPEQDKQISRFNNSGLSFDQMAQTQDFRYKSFDGMDMHAILVTQKQWAKGSKKYPVIIWPHGGPDWYAGHEYYPYFQYYALNDFIVLAPNFRGSTSFGKKFETLNDKDWGGGHIKDLVWAKKALKSLPYADLDNVFIAGRSFGGYSTLAAITYHPKEFKAAVAIVAIGDLFEFMATIPPSESWQNEFKSEVGIVGKDDKLIRERSPFFHAEKVSIPLKVYHTENDTRTRVENMDKYVARLKELKKPVEYEVIPDEGHAPKKKETWEKLLKGTVDFLNKQKETTL